MVGHWPVSLYSKNGTKGIHSNPIFCHKKKIISIDGGCGLTRYGQLNLLILPEIDCPAKDIHFICYDGLPVIRALDFQKGSSEDSVNILWGNNDIRILEKGKEFSYILHTASHRKLWVPTELIIDDRQCADYTDYTLPVCPGDSLSLIKSTSKGHMVKKNGVTGWYYGRISMESLS